MGDGVSEMELKESDLPALDGRQCAKCQKPIMAGDAYRLGSKTLCEDCYISARMTRTRKTHWQYLSCFKTQYLREADQD